ncbi:MAG TPA: TIGR03960 family B12-binding radical SAM protein [Ruminococcaceae bacterium]|nr:TIGR03960 family B12-binding radical SAM protein [Oscillospiraceae bacterium]
MDEKRFEQLLLTVQKPGRYSGGEINSVIKDKSEIDIRFAFCFPDNYEVGMSHLGIKILYSLFNERKDIWCERVFAPWPDFESVMRNNNISLFAIESRDPIKDFDFIGFTLQYELSYSNVLNMLELAGVPLLSKDRTDFTPLVVAGGPCTCNAEPLADFVDIFFLGEGEEADLEVIDLYKKYKHNGGSKSDFLREASKIEGVYVPSLYDVDYKEDGTVLSITPKFDDLPFPVRKRIEYDLDKTYYPEKFVVPYIEIIHDRAVQEIFRGCIRGCRFCQAGFIYRPVREKSVETICRQAKALCDSTGYDEISLSSLSTSDYRDLENLLNKMLDWTEKERISLSLPSLRIDNFSDELLEKINHVRKSGLTFAAEAGTQRLRNVINKNITEEEIINTCKTAFEGGYTAVKLYFMMGLPTETYDDIKGIADLAQKIVDTFYEMPNKPKGKSVSVNISVSNFVPKPFTPFQFHPQITRDEIIKKQQYLKECIRSRKISYSYHENKTSFLEGVFARGDRRLSAVLLKAHEKGCKFDSWDEYFDLDKWMKAFDECGLNPEFYANRERPYDEITPWEHIDFCVSKEFLISENEKAKQAVTTPHCRQQCQNCGANVFGKGVCFEKR